MCAVNLQTLGAKDQLENIAQQVVNDVKSDVKEGITNIQKEALSFFGKVKAKITQNLSALKGLFITGSMVMAIVAAVKGLAAVGLAALGPAGWAVIGGAFLIGLAISAYSAHAKGKNAGDVFKSMLSDICTYTALCVLSVVNKMISEGKSFWTAIVALKDDILGTAEEELNKIKTDIDICFKETKGKINEIFNTTLERLNKKRELLESMYVNFKEKIEEQQAKNKKEDSKKLQELTVALENFKEGKLKEFSDFIDNLKKETGKINDTFSNFLNEITKEQRVNGAIVKTDVKKLIKDFQNKISDVHESLGNIVLKANSFLKAEIELPQSIATMLQNGVIKTLEYGTSEIAQKCFAIDEAFSGNQKVKSILKGVSENIKNKNFEDLQGKFNALTNLAKETGKEVLKRQIEALKVLSQNAAEKYSAELTTDKMQVRVQGFFNEFFGIKEEPPKDVRNPENNLINAEQPA